MAGVQPPELAIAVSRAGALGSIAGAMLAPDELRETIRSVRAALGDLPFAVNLFAPPYSADALYDVVLEECPPVFSYTFAPVDPAPFRERGLTVLGTATTAEEAQALDVDAVVAQGAEAGGHRGSFLGDELVPLAELVPACLGDVPVIAAGGITTRDDVRAALELGAAGVQVGTAFLFTPECRVRPEHLEALRTRESIVTDAYTGRAARMARTPVIDELLAGPPPLPYGEQRAVSAKVGPLYLGGLGAPRVREMPADELVRELTRRD
ncbi:MAG: nitronate monooxygenase [Gaiellaceae bacterium]|jgi:nitronate monooxygenase|nr:nitronate monooxygenase [Gaiellaceae bacterium]